MNGRPNSREMAMLILQRGGEAGLTWPLEHKTLMIGRSADCEIVLDDRQVSRFMRASSGGPIDTRWRTWAVRTAPTSTAAT